MIRTPWPSAVVAVFQTTARRASVGPGTMVEAMADSLTGLLHGNTITLDGAVPPLEGRRVRVMIEPLEDKDAPFSRERQQELWQEWSERGPQGPIEDEDEPDLP